MRLDSEQRHLLAKARIGMLAINAGRLPLVNAAAFHFGGDALWMTTSRHAAKLPFVRRDPRASFLVAPEAQRGGHGILLQGLLEAYDPLSAGSHLRAVLKGPAFAYNLAGYALKNLNFIGGYLMDLPQVPGGWWPHNRVLLRLIADRVRLVPGLAPPAATAERIPGVSAQIAHTVAKHRVAQLCWLVGGRLVLASVTWALDGADALAWLPAHVPRPPATGEPAALLVERHHPYRATRMFGCCLRGHVTVDPEARATIAARYRGVLPEGGTVVRLEVKRVTSWRGFEVWTRSVARSAAPAMAAGAP